MKTLKGYEMRWLLLFTFLCVGCSKPEVVSKNDPASKSGESNPTAGFPPEAWTHRELASFLEQKGLKVRVEAKPVLSAPGRTVASLAVGEGDNLAAVGSILCADEKAAREVAGSFGAGAFHRGRFAFGHGDNPNDRDRDLLKRIDAALK